MVMSIVDRSEFECLMQICGGEGGGSIKGEVGLTFLSYLEVFFY